MNTFAFRIFRAGMVIVLTVGLLFNPITSVSAQNPLQTNPSIWADPDNELINGFGWMAGETVTVNVYDPDDVLVYTADQVVRSDGSVGFGLRKEGIDLQVGYRVTMSNGFFTKELIVSTLKITNISLSARTITGIYDPNLGFWINAQGQQPENLTFNSAEWVATFAELPAGTQGNVAQPDEDGDMTGIGFCLDCNNFILADPNLGQILGFEWVAGETMTVNIYDPGNILLYTADRVVRRGSRGPSHGNVDFEVGAEGLQAGYRITMSDGFSTKELIVSTLEITDISLSTRTIAGIYDPNLEFSIEVTIDGQEQQPENLVFDGTQWVATFAELPVCIRGSVAQPNGYGNSTAVGFYLDCNNHIWADPNGDWTGGFEWVAGETITVNVYDRDNILLYTADQVVQRPAPGNGYHAPWNGSAEFGLWAEGVDLQAGYRVTMSVGFSTKELIVSTLEITDINPSTRTITGIYDPSLGFWINVQGQQPENQVFDGTEWVATFAELPADAYGEVGQPDEDGDITFIGYHVPIPPLTLTGFYPPVDMNGVYNIVKGGSTLPLKFEIFSGSTELTDTAYIKSLTYAQTSCDATAITDEIETTATGGTSLRYDAVAGQFVYNWKTPGKCYRVTMITMDGSSLLAYFKLK